VEDPGIDGAADAREDGMDELTEVVDHCHLDPVAPERAGEGGGSDVVAGAEAGGEEEDTRHRAPGSS
jgi:hypothetical protein